MLYSLSLSLSLFLSLSLSLSAVILVFIDQTSLVKCFPRDLRVRVQNRWGIDGLLIFFHVKYSQIYIHTHTHTHAYIHIYVIHEYKSNVIERFIEN